MPKSPKELKKANNWSAMENVDLFVTCPHCKEELQYSVLMAAEGDRHRCYECGKDFELGIEE